MKLLDLFSGIGGFSLAGRWAGFETIQFVEIDPFCQKILQKNWPHVPIHDDIKTFTYKGDKPITLLTSGFPCQPFSIAGKKKGKNDERYLWPEIFRLIKECRANWIILENVPNIIKFSLDDILMDLESEKYSTETYIIPACAARTPHKRERLWIVANFDSERCDIRKYHRKIRYLKDNFNRYFETIYKEWSQLIPEPWKTYTVDDWMLYNTRISRENDGISNRMDKNRIKTLGNSIVPQVVYPIMKLIYEIENNNE